MSVLARRRADYNEGHPATLPISSDLPLSEPVTFTDPDYFDYEPSLNGDEAAHFKREGFIVKRASLMTTEIFQRSLTLSGPKCPAGYCAGRILIPGSILPTTIGQKLIH